MYSLQIFSCILQVVCLLYQLFLLLCRSEEHTSELQSPCNLVCRLLLEKKKNTIFLLLVFFSLFIFLLSFSFFFFFNDTATTEIYTLSLHDALPILSFCYVVKLFEFLLNCGY